jgi:hypothetical protein
MSGKIEGLNIRELLKNTYDRLAERHDSQEIVLQKRVLTEIANDSDYHRIRIGFMKYDNIRLFQFNEKNWVIARGEKCGSYPAERYDSDLLALEFPIEGKDSEQIQKELRERIEQSQYFQNSLVFGMDDGNLGVSEDGIFKEKILGRLNPRIQDFIAQEPEYDKSMILTSTLHHPTTKSMLYKPEFVDFLADSIEAVLK